MGVFMMRDVSKLVVVNVVLGLFMTGFQPVARAVVSAQDPCADRPEVFRISGVPPGAAVVTCFSGYINNNPGQPPDPSGPVVAVIDVRDPLSKGAVLGRNYPAPMYHNLMPNPTHNPADQWIARNLGQVFGITLDDATPPNIYVTATTVYGRFAFGPGGPGAVYRLDGRDGRISVFAQLPNTGPALGNITYDHTNQQFFVSNFEDGKIYRIRDVGGTGSIRSSFDPFSPDTGTPGFAPLGERVWGVGVFRNRLYFSVWREDKMRLAANAANEVWSVGLTASGNFDVSTLRREFAAPDLLANNGLGLGYSNPISDITFSPSEPRMLIAERSRTTGLDTGTLIPRGSDAHESRVIEYVFQNDRWVRSQATFYVGNHPGRCSNFATPACSPGRHTNAAGGASYDCLGDVWVTGDALRFEEPIAFNAPPLGGQDIYVYGLQWTPGTGNGPNDIDPVTPGFQPAPNAVALTSIFIDLNCEFTKDDKVQIGDIVLYNIQCLCDP